MLLVIGSEFSMKGVDSKRTFARPPAAISGIGV